MNKALKAFGLSTILLHYMPAFAAILVNNSSGNLAISNGLLNETANATIIAPGNSFIIPDTWGDQQHVYLHIAANGVLICGNQYGVAKLPAQENQQVTANLACTTFNGSIPINTPTPVPNPTPTSVPTPTPTSNPTPSNLLQVKANGTWIYDAQFNDGPTGGAYTKAGLWSTNLNNYNSGARASSKINQFFTYGGDLEMYCRGSGDSATGDTCNSKNMLVLYYPVSFYNTNLSLEQLGDSGYSSTLTYFMAANNNYSSTQTSVQITPIIDGRVDNSADNDYLNAFNIMTQNEAQLLADNVARVYCADNRITGVQFDIEPFDFSKLGQKYFYTQLAKDFAGANTDVSGVDRFHCKNSDHPYGRSFSIFTFPSHVTSEVVNILNSHNNGYVIYSLYDLPAGAAVGPVNSPTDYYSLVRAEIAKAVANQAYFQLAIPGAASVHEYEALNGKSTGYKQIDYVKSAIKAINDSGVRSNPKFIGVAIWGWSKYMSYPPHSSNLYTPNIPPQDVLSYLQQNM